MKKIFMSIMAFAAMAMTITSCNKEEATLAGDFDASFEDTEVMNQAKTHFVGNDQYWDNGDLVYIMDGSNNIATYSVDETGHHTFVENIRGTFSETNGTLTAFYPVSIVHNANANEIRLPAVQTTVAGETQWPMYAKGTIVPENTFHYQNLCALVTLYLKGDVTLDSIKVTTDKYINGHFKINMASANPLSYQSGGYAVLAHGTKTNTLKFKNSTRNFPLTSTEQEINISIPSGTYKLFTITFYANGKKYVKTNGNTPMVFDREHFNYAHIQLNTTDFEDFVDGVIDAQYNVAGEGETPQYIVFSKGNLEYVSLPNQYWQFADNQFDFRGRYQCKVQNQYDRDLFAWGANGYYNGTSRVQGNGITIWGNETTYDFDYSTARTLQGTSEWGNNKIANGGKRANSGWRTLTATEMQNLLNNYDHAMVNLTFAGKTGMIIFPEGVTPVADGTSITKSEWTILENAGCIFFVADYYRGATGAVANRMSNAGSYFWLSTAANNTTASALYIDKVAGESIINNANKKIGGFVRLVKDVQ